MIYANAMTPDGLWKIDLDPFLNSLPLYFLHERATCLHQRRSITHWLDQVGPCYRHKEARGLTLIKGDDLIEILHSDTYEAIDSSKANLNGKIIFICGASKGISRSISLSFAKAGASCIAIGARSNLATLEDDIRDAALAVQKEPPNVMPLQVDVTDQKSVESAAASIENRFGRLNILIHNAAIISTPSPIIDSDAEAWWKIWDVNVRGAYLVTRAFLPLMLKGGRQADSQCQQREGFSLWTRI